jgi:hypothetical protein
MSNRGRLGGLNWVPMGSEILGKNLVDKRLKELNVRRRIAFKRHTARACDCRDQPRVVGFALFMATTRADTGDPIGFGGRR